MKFDSNYLIKELQSVFLEDTITYIVKYKTTRNQTYCVRTESAKWVVKIAKQEESSRLHWEFAVMKECYHCGGAVAKPHRESEIQIDGIRYCVNVYSYLEGKEMKQSPTGAFQFGQALAQLHHAFEHKTDVTNQSWETQKRNPIDLQFLRNALQSMEAECSSWYDFREIEGYVQKIAMFLQENEREEYFCMIHGDAHFRNVRVQPDGKMVWFDFEDACYQWRTYDLATAIWGTYGSGGTKEIWNAIVEGYCSIHELQDKEFEIMNQLIFVRHLWWLGLNACHWEEWKLPYTKRYFFQNGLDLLVEIAQNVCELEEEN